MSDIMERLEAEAKARDWRADYLTAPSRAADPRAEIEADYCRGRATLAREAKAEITRLRSLVEEAGKVVEEMIDPMQYAYRNVSSVTADRVKAEILPAARSLLTKMKEG